jgi:uncharacterized protein
MSKAALSLSIVTARRFMRLATGLGHRFASVSAALDHLGFVQIDPINVCGRMQDHILRHRVAGYAEGDLMRHVHRDGPRSALEHHLPDSSNLAAMPMEAWPHLLRTMKARASRDSLWSGRLTAAEKKLSKHVLDRMKDEGPLCSQDIDSPRKAKQHEWDSTTLAKSTLQKLFFHGQVLIAKREGLRRFYDLPERVVPSAVLSKVAPSPEVTEAWLAELKLKQRRLAILKPKEASVLGSKAISVQLTELPNLKLHVLASDLPLLGQAEREEPSSKPVLIAPLDPVIYDRKVTEQLWGYSYRWEVYTPPAKRVRGYYALPLLEGIRFTGHADVKADREADRLVTLASDGGGVRAAVQELATFLGLKSG